MWPIKRKQKQDPSILDQYLKLSQEGRFKEALPLIKTIVDRAPQVPTSWFNLGICEAGLGWHGRAARSFLKAYDLDPDDGGALYRACISLARAKDRRSLLDIMQRECQRDPSMIHNFIEDEHFESLFSLRDFEKLRDRYLE